MNGKSGGIHLISFKYGLRVIARTKLRSGLFCLLLTTVTVFLSLGIGMWRSAEDMLNKADEVFVTAGEFVYTFGNYPETDFYDPRLAAARETFDLGAFDRDGALMVEGQQKSRAYIEGYNAEKSDMPLGDFAVLTVKAGYYYSELASYVSGIVEAHYLVPVSRNSVGTPTAVYVSPPPDNSFEIEPGQTYVMFGYLYSVPKEPMTRFEVLSFSEALGVDPAHGDYLPIADVTDGGEAEFWNSNAGKYYTEIIELLSVVNSTIDVVATSRVEALEPFHRGAYNMIEGGYFTKGDYEAGLACIISSDVAGMLNLSVGDRLPLNFYTHNEDFWPEDGFPLGSDCVIRGIYQAEKTGTPVYIPYTGQAWLETDEYDYTLGRVVVDNRSAEEYETAVAELLPEGVRLDLYDQGYAAAAQPLTSMRETAIFISVVCAFACLLVLWFFAYLFVYRSGVSVKILLLLGSGARRTRTFLLTGCGAVALTASAAGGIVGYLISRSFISAVYSSLETNSVYDYRFSIKGFGVQSEAFTATPEPEPAAYALAALGVFLLALFLCAFFAAQVMGKQSAKERHRRAKKQSRKPRTNKKALYIPVPGISLRYSVTGILRGGLQSVCVPAIFMVLILFMCVFTGMRTGYESRLENVYNDIPVALRFTDVTGRKIDGLAISSNQLEEMESTGFIGESWTVTGWRYMFNGVTLYADGTLPDDPPEPVKIPKQDWFSQFARELFLGELKMNSNPIIGTDNVARAPEFFYYGEPEITWAEGLGWDEFRLSWLPGTLTNKDFNEYYGVDYFGDDFKCFAMYCLVPTDFLETHNVSLGDIILTTLFYKLNGEMTSAPYEFVIAGSYTPRNTQETIYAPTSAVSMWYTDGTMTMDENGDIHYNVYQVFDSAGFTLTDTERLSEFKDWLSESYDRIGNRGFFRRWLIIDDKALYDTIDDLTRHIGYMDMLYPVILALVAAIGFIASALLLRGRLEEIAILRSLGAGRLRVFFSFFLDSVILSIPGIGLGLGLALLVLGGWQGEFLQNAALFTPCYYLGAAVAITQTYRRAVLQSLSQKEE